MLKKGGTINKEQNTGTGAWIGEENEVSRSMSTLAIEGGSAGAGISAASGTSFNDSTDVCGLRVHGNVQGYSTLEVTDDPIYSDGTNYYYYVVADNAVNGGKAFKEPEDANYIVCYRTLEGGKIGWYLRERPTISVNNELLRAGETGEVVLTVVMNSFGYEWSDSASDNRVDFRIVKNAGTDAEVSIDLATMAGITAHTGNFGSVVKTAGDVDYLESFVYVIDNSAAGVPTYYTVEARYHVVASGYDDVRTAAETEAARCVYEFTGDTVMTTFPNNGFGMGDDTATLRIALPSGVNGTLAAAENDGHFGFENNSIDAQLEPYTTVTSDYSAANETTANSRFGVTIGGADITSGSGVALGGGTSNLTCAVYSYKNLSIDDFSKDDVNGLSLSLTLSGLTKNSETVGSGAATALNSGELKIRTVGTYKISYQFTTRAHGGKTYVVKGKLADALDASGVAGGKLTNAFVLSKAPYESNYGETLSWPDTGITLTHLGYSRNRWTDENGEIAASGETDLLYTDFEIAFSDGANPIYGEGSGYGAGVVFELCGKMGASATFDPGRDYGFYSDPEALKEAIKNNATSYTTKNKTTGEATKTRSIQCSEIDTTNISQKNRIEFALYYRNAYTLVESTKNYTNSVYLMKATAYLVHEDAVTLSNSVYICFKAVAAKDLIND